MGELDNFEITFISDSDNEETENGMKLPSMHSVKKRPIEEIYKVLKDNLIAIVDYPPDKVLDSCKYVRLARKYNLTNYKLLLYKDLARLGLTNDFTTWQKQVMAEAGAMVVIFNELNGNLISLAFRSTVAKEFIDFSIYKSLYGYDLMDPNFKYGDFIILTEGFYDADVLRQIYPNVLATQTSNINNTQANILRTLTDRVIVAYDSDAAGESGYQKTTTKMTDMILHRLEIYKGDKDIGNMEEKKESNPEEGALREKFYRGQLEDIFNMY